MDNQSPAILRLRHKPKLTRSVVVEQVSVIGRPLFIDAPKVNKKSFMKLKLFH